MKKPKVAECGKSQPTKASKANPRGLKLAKVKSSPSTGSKGTKMW